MPAFQALPSAVSRPSLAAQDLDRSLPPAAEAMAETGEILEGRTDQPAGKVSSSGGEADKGFGNDLSAALSGGPRSSGLPVMASRAAPRSMGNLWGLLGGGHSAAEVGAESGRVLRSAEFGERIVFTFKKARMEGLLMEIREGKATFAIQTSRGWKPKTVKWSQIQAVERKGETEENTVTEAARSAGFQPITARLALKRTKDYLTWKERDLWAEIRDDVNAEIDSMKGTPKEEFRSFLDETAEAVLERIKKRYGTDLIGFHYNMGGGEAVDFVRAGGILAQKGSDSSAQYGNRHANSNPTVYFFLSSYMRFFGLLDQRHLSQPMLISRMGSVLVLFRRDDPHFDRKRREGVIVGTSDSNMDFAKEGVGIPLETFIGFPLEVYKDNKKKLGRKKLSRDEETLSAIRYIEAAYLSD